MKLNIATLALTIASSSFLIAQEGGKSYEPITFEKGKDGVKPFTNKERKFNDWSVSFGAGIPLIQSADMTSIKNGNGSGRIGHSYFVSVDKAITHAFGLSLQYDGGETKQSDAGDVTFAKTKFNMVSLLGDINFSNIFRRVDNRSPYRWALHGYAGIGMLGYETTRKDPGSNEYITQTDQKLGMGSFAFQAGAGVKYKLNRRVDLGLKAMYVYTGDDEFDGGGEQYSLINMTEEQNSDNMFNINLGVTLKLGKHASHLMWHDPMQEIYHRLENIPTPDLEVCKNGDGDNDGVCDDWDRQLNTPAGARVDGAGIALDTDLDGVIDLNDKCVTVPGPASNNGCPEQPKAVAPTQVVDVSTDLERALKDILFVFNKTEIRAESFDKLDLAADIIKSSGGGTYLLVGHTDKKGNDLYNLNLSKGRARQVMLELEKRGVNPNQLKSIGVGEQMAVIPETASDEERLSDRKVTVRFVTGNEWSSLRKSDAEPVRKAPAKKGSTKKVVKKRK